MRRSIVIKAKLGPEESDFVAATVAAGLYMHRSEYIRDLIRRDKMRDDAEKRERLKGQP